MVKIISLFDIYYFINVYLCVCVGGGKHSFLEVGKEFHGYYLDVVNFILFFILAIMNILVIL